MPTYSLTDSFLRDYKSLTLEERKAFREAVKKFVADLRTGKFRKGLRVKGVEGAQGVYEMTWAGNGRATFQYGPPVRANDADVIWRRCGGHAIFGRP